MNADSKSADRLCAVNAMGAISSCNRRTADTNKVLSSGPEHLPSSVPLRPELYRCKPRPTARTQRTPQLGVFDSPEEETPDTDDEAKVDGEEFEHETSYPCPNCRQRALMWVAFIHALRGWQVYRNTASKEARERVEESSPSYRHVPIMTAQQLTLSPMQSIPFDHLDAERTRGSLR